MITFNEIKNIKEINTYIKKSLLKINTKHTIIKLKLEIDTKIRPVMEYFEIFSSRMILCRKAAETLGV